MTRTDERISEGCTNMIGTFVVWWVSLWLPEVMCIKKEDD